MLRVSPPAFLKQRSERLLLLLFLLSLPLINPWVRGDGVGYYAFARAPLIQRNLDFSGDFRHANLRFSDKRIDENGDFKSYLRTNTGHLDNHFTVGPAMLWAPFLLVAHAGVLLARALGSHVAADGFSAPYRIAMAFGTGLYGFLALLLSFRLARQYFAERWALLATIGIWGASSLPVYMYFNPSWSHAHSAFMVALFAWYWHRTRDRRATKQWIILALIVGLMLNVYYANAMLLVILAIEAFRQYAARIKDPAAAGGSAFQLAANHAVFGVVTIVAMLPTFVTRYIVYGSPFASGYRPLSVWNWLSPEFVAVLFSADHGLLSWTPVLLLSVAGLVLLCWRRHELGEPFLAGFVAFYLFIACYPSWDGISSFGNRFFVSLTVFFLFGLAAFLEAFAIALEKWSKRFAASAAYAIVTGLICWNLGFIFQWGMHLIPPRGPIDWTEMAHNQFAVVPREISAQLDAYLFRRRALMQQIEKKDIEQMKGRDEE